MDCLSCAWLVACKALIAVCRSMSKRRMQPLLQKEWPMDRSFGREKTLKERQRRHEGKLQREKGSAGQDRARQKLTAKEGELKEQHLLAVLPRVWEADRRITFRAVRRFVKCGAVVVP